MNIIIAKDYDEMSRLAADLIAAQITMKPNCVLGLATGSTPIGTYKELIARYEAKRLDFSAVSSINLDEYCGLDGNNDQSYRYFMNHNLFDHVNICKERTFVPNGLAKDVAAECKSYDERIEKMGIDLQVLGIGHDGHIGFNEPEDSFPVGTHLAQLEDTTIQANARFFASMDEVPKTALTMGIWGIMQAKKVLLLAGGADKTEIMKKALFGPVTPRVPASILQLHPDVTVITVCDLT